METYEYHLTKKGAEVWLRDSQLRNGRTWRQHLMDLACIPAKAHGCNEVRLVGPDGDVFVEAGVGGDGEDL